MRSASFQRPGLGQIVNKGNFYPPTARTPEGLAYGSRRKGALICWNYASFYGGPWGNLLNTARPAPSRSLVDVQNVNVDLWIATLVELGFDYVIFTIQEEHGFNFWPSRVPRNFAQVSLPTGPNGSAFLSPSAPDGPFGARSGAMDCHIVDKLVAACKKYNMPLGLYMNMLAQLEVFNATFDFNNHALASYPRYQEYQDYFCRLVQEVLIRWPYTSALWLDKANPTTPAFGQAVYNAAKAINPSIFIMANTTGEYTMSPGRGPYDGQSIEEYVLLAGGNTSYQNRYRDFAGASRYVEQEFVLTPHKNNQWYNYDDQNIFQFPNKPYLQFQPTSDFQRLLDLAKQQSVPVLMDILIDRNGNLVQQTLEYLSHLDFSR